MTSNMRSRGPSGSAFQRGSPSDEVAGILLELSFEVPHEALFAFLRPPLRRTEPPMLEAAVSRLDRLVQASAKNFRTKHFLMSEARASD